MHEHRLALVTTSATFLLLIAGGLVHATGSGLACPEAWFICNGSLFPRMVGGVLFEHGHRLIAMGVGLLTLAFAGLCLWRRRADRGLVRLSLLAVGLVWLQGSLGALTVRYKLPWFVSSAHLAVSMVFLSLFVLLCFRSLPAPRGETERGAPAGLRPWVALATAATYAQIVLGALVRHKGAGLACNVRLPLCDGHFWPAWGPAQLHMVHRYAALLLTALVIAASVQVWRRRRELPRLAVRLALVAPALVLAQIGLGLLSVLGAAALLLASLVGLTLAIGPLGARLREQPATAVEPVSEQPLGEALA
jgi:heme A synthase